LACFYIAASQEPVQVSKRLVESKPANGNAHLELEEAVRLEVDCARTYEQLGRAREAKGDTAGARVAFDKACTLALTGKAGNGH